MRLKKFLRGIGDKLRMKPKIRFRTHSLAVSDPRSMRKFAEYIQHYTSITPRNVFEIGANYAQDAEGLRHYFDLKDQDVYVFEAHPQMVEEIRKMYNFHTIDKAVFNESTILTFNAVDITSVSNKYNIGMSSIFHDLAQDLERDYRTFPIQVQAIRMDEWMSENKIGSICFLKLDVEGGSYEVLEGFGSRLSDVKSIHVEAEHIARWAKTKLYDDIAKLLHDNNFEQVYFCKKTYYSDSFWIQKKYLNPKKWVSAIPNG